MEGPPPRPAPPARPRLQRLRRTLPRRPRRERRRGHQQARDRPHPRRPGRGAAAGPGHPHHPRRRQPPRRLRHRHLLGRPARRPPVRLGLGPARGAGLLYRQAYLVTRPKERLDVARAMYAMRFPGEDVSTATMQQLRGREGTRIRRLYEMHSERTGVPWTRRHYKAGDAYAAGDDLNRLLSAANAALYGICHAVIVGLGASPGLGFVHTGSAISFVLDIADLYKADYTIPLAFDLAAQGLTEERDARTGLRDLIAENRLLRRIVHDVRTLLTPDEATRIPVDEDVNQLWDDQVGAVAGGVNWSGSEDLIQPGMGDQHIAIIGPEFDPPASDPAATS
ncbi:type I-E CRISPR-associated endonuclease Cas1e [Actinomadura keratinilytica]|uniref:type I-E CRISPR-associated endonuclease Cas1e n=1 Tax=Actinomadura keratinilytica TaxID=547461 RepID=UPI0036147319